MPSDEIRKRFLTFFEKRGHAVVPSASLVPEGDATTLFTTAGMQPLVPYLLGQQHPKGNRIVNVQKSLRTGDIEEVGDNTHLTFFEMLGNWSLGEYFKEEAIAWSYELLTSTEEGFGLDPNRLYITVFEGNSDAPRDEESVEIWKRVGVPENRIYFRSEKDNWWSPGDNGPCGPDTEMFYDLTPGGLGDLTDEEFANADEEQKVVEIWNDVFMEYEKKDGKVVGKLEQKNVDTGSGLERVTAILQGKNNVFEIDSMQPLVDESANLSDDLRAQRIIADHIRSVVFMIADGVLPANTDRGYVLRRLIRRAVVSTKQRDIAPEITSHYVEVVVSLYGRVYPELVEKKETIISVLSDEVSRFSKTLSKGLKEFEKLSGDISGPQAFNLYQTYGFPVEMTEELAHSKKVSVDTESFWKEFKYHQEKSRTSAAGKFKGGLGDHGEDTIKLHTTHHLLLAALQKELGDSVKQKGSNITPERLRIDFSFDRKLTDEEKENVTKHVNGWIQNNLDVVRKEMSLSEAKELGAEMEFGAKYPDTVTVYFVQDSYGNVISKEFCGGPHTGNTGDLGTFRIKSEKASSAGVRRIKAVLE